MQKTREASLIQKMNLNRVSLLLFQPLSVQSEKKKDDGVDYLLEFKLKRLT